MSCYWETTTSGQCRLPHRIITQHGKLKSNKPLPALPPSLFCLPVIFRARKLKFPVKQMKSMLVIIQVWGYGDYSICFAQYDTLGYHLYKWIGYAVVLPWRHYVTASAIMWPRDRDRCKWLSTQSHYQLLIEFLVFKKYMEIIRKQTPPWFCGWRSWMEFSVLHLFITFPLTIYFPE